MNKAIIATFEDLYIAYRLWGFSKEGSLSCIKEMQKKFTLDDLRNFLIKEKAYQGKILSPSGKEKTLEELYERIIHGKVIDPIDGKEIVF